MSSMADRPPADPARLLAALDAWAAGDMTAGTAMQALKRGGLDELLASMGEDAQAVVGPWNEWERGRSNPNDTLQALEAAGVRAVLTRTT